MAVSDLFFHLTPDKILDAVEVQGLRATGRVMALSSYENRVYDVELEDGGHRVLKFYRPGRWSREAILDEHRFLADLMEEGVPVACAEALRPGADLPTVAEMDGILYASFPKIRGRMRMLDELSGADLMAIGRLLGRLHNIGERREAAHRPRFHPETYALAEVGFLIDRFVPAHLSARYRAAAERVRAACAPLHDLSLIRVHGDCHLGNLIYTGDGPTFLDFDDFLMGPPVHDLWLLGDGDEGRMGAVVAGYEELRRLDRGTLRLVETLRALRMIRHAAWIGRRYHDPAFQRAFSNFLEPRFWTGEVDDLERQLERILG